MVKIPCGAWVKRIETAIERFGRETAKVPLRKTWHFGKTGGQSPVGVPSICLLMGVLCSRKGRGKVRIKIGPSGKEPRTKVAVATCVIAVAVATSRQARRAGQDHHRRSVIAGRSQISMIARIRTVVH